MQGPLSMSSAAMPTATLIDPVILDTVLGRLALLFLTGAADDMTVARHAARRLLAAYRVETEEELSLAAEIISFGYHALQALSQAMEPDLPLNKVIRLRGSAVSLSREGHRNQRKLDQLQRDRRVAAPLADSAPQTPDAPAIDKATRPETATREVAKPGAVPARTWTQAYHDRQRDKRLAESARKQASLACPPAPLAATMACSTSAQPAALPVAQAG